MLTRISKSKFLPLAIILIDLMLFFMLYDYSQKQINSYKNSQITSLAEDYKAAVATYRDITKNIYDLTINRDDILSLYASAYANGDQNNSIRSKMIVELNEPYNILKADGLKQLHFHTTTGNSFLRMHSKDKFGDPLADVRPSIKIANYEHKYVEGFEEGRIYNGFRYVYPLFFDGKHIGSVETSISAGEMMKYIMSVSSGYYQMYFDNKMVEDTVWSKEADKHYRGITLSGKLLEETTGQHSEVEHSINSKLADKIAKDLDSYKPIVESAEYNGKNYVAVFLPVKNVAGKNVAYIARYFEDDSLQLIKHDFYLKAALDLIATLILMLIISVLRREIRLKEEAQRQLELINVSLESEVEKKILEYKEQEQLLIQHSKMASMGEMIGAIAHQWKQPLNVLSISVQDIRFAQECGELDESYLKKYVDRTLETINNMSKTIDDFKNFFSPHKKTEEFFVEDAIDETLRMLRPQFKSHGISIEFNNVKNERHSIISIKNELKQVLLNIIANAKDAITERQPSEPTITIDVSERGNDLAITVEDNAGGIPEEIVEKIFDAHFTTKAEGKGTGIGLYMSRQIVVDSLNGKLEVENTENGAKFAIIMGN